MCIVLLEAFRPAPRGGAGWTLWNVEVSRHGNGTKSLEKMDRYFYFACRSVSKVRSNVHPNTAEGCSLLILTIMHPVLPYLYSLLPLRAASPGAIQKFRGARNPRYLIAICCWRRTRVILSPYSCGNAMQR